MEIQSSKYNLDIEEIDRKLEADVIKYKKHLMKVWIITALVLAFIFRGQIYYWFKFAPVYSYKKDKTPISLENEPIQNDYTMEERKAKTFVYKSLLNGNKITVIPVADYKIAGMVIATNRFFLFKSEFFDSAALYDIGLTWGKLGDKKLYRKYFESYSRKNEMTGSRMLWVSWKNNNDLPVSLNYATSHWSHTHIVPANRNIMGALLRVREWDKIEMEGMLVDMEYVGKKGREYKYRTSMTRTDSMPYGDRGYGNCETMYVTKIKLKNKLYK